VACHMSKRIKLTTLDSSGIDLDLDVFIVRGDEIEPNTIIYLGINSAILPFQYTNLLFSLINK